MWRPLRRTLQGLVIQLSKVQNVQECDATGDD